MDLILTTGAIQAYLESMEQSGYSSATVDTYRARLVRFYAWLPPGKRVGPDTLDRWTDALAAAGYASRTLNLSVSAVNSLLVFCRRRELCGEQRPVEKREEPPRLNRQEYMRMLTAARLLDREREYCLIQVFGSAGLRINSLPLLTVEAAQAGFLREEDGETVRLPDYLCRDLLAYGRRQGIASGPLFVNKQGRPLDRGSVTRAVQSICRDARVEEEKATPRCLRKLYQVTEEQIRAGFDEIAAESLHRLLETEHAAAAWSE